MLGDVLLQTAGGHEVLPYKTDIIYAAFALPLFFSPNGQKNRVKHGHSAVSFTILSASSGRIKWELVAFDLPLFFFPYGQKNRVRA